MASAAEGGVVQNATKAAPIHHYSKSFTAQWTHGTLTTVLSRLLVLGKVQVFPNEDLGSILNYLSG
jgi:hypothetical protein